MNMKFAATVLAFTALSAASFAQAAMVAVPVLKSPLQKGALITEDNLATTQLPQNQVYASTITQADQLAGLTTVRPLPAGQPINRLHVKATAAVNRNDMVDIRYTRGAVELTVKGQALEDGQIGQTIKVINPATRTTLAGTVRENGVVEIN